jgi:hypothetical protein
MRLFTKFLAVALLSATGVEMAEAQSPTLIRPGLPAAPSFSLPAGVRPVPTLSPLPAIQPGGCFPPRPFPNPGLFPFPLPNPEPIIDIDYKVYYRFGPGYRWRLYDIVDTGRELRLVQRYLESMGYEMQAVEVFGNGLR